MKRATFSFVLLCCALSGFSQVLYGPKAGINFSSFTGNDIHDANYRPSFHAGGFVNFLLFDQISLQPELLFSGKGAKTEVGNYQLGYIELPVVAQYNTTSGIFFEAGPQAALRVSANKKQNGRTFNQETQIRSADFSWVVGVGYKLIRGIGVGARYDFGFYDIANSGIIRNKTIMVSLLYTFGPPPRL